MKVCLLLQALNDKIGQGGRITAMYYREAVCSTRSHTCFWQMLCTSPQNLSITSISCPSQCKWCRIGSVSCIMTYWKYLHVLQCQQGSKLVPQVTQRINYNKRLFQWHKEMSESDYQITFTVLVNSKTYSFTKDAQPSGTPQITHSGEAPSYLSHVIWSALRYCWNACFGPV